MTTAMQNSVAHDTVVIERTYTATPRRAFAAWADVEARKRWTPPAPNVEVVFDAHDFRVGGKDVVRCGEKGNLRYHAEVHYLDIIKDARIIFSERVAEDGRLAATAPITTEFRAKGKDTLLVLTMQIAALDNADMLAGYRVGWTAALDNLTTEF